MPTPPCVRDLLTGFVPGDWVRSLDLSMFERCSGSDLAPPMS
jgi:hypothetical protein